MKLITRLVFSLVVGLTSISHAVATGNAHHSGNHTAVLADGEVRKVDKGLQKITIKHGHLKNLDMPPMTMVFQVKDPSLLDKVKAGDRVGFVAEKISGKLTVTKIEARQP